MLFGTTRAGPRKCCREHVRLRPLRLPVNAPSEGLSGCLLGVCLLKTVSSCVRVSNHVPNRRVALLAPLAARRGVGADVDRFCRLQRRHADAALARFLVQSLCLGSRRHGAASPDRAPRTAAKSPPATAIPIPVTGPAAADRCTAV